MVFGAGLYELAEKSLLATLPGITALEPIGASGAAAAVGGAPAKSPLSGATLAAGPGGGGGEAL